MLTARVRQKYYRDLDPSFELHPITNDLSRLFDEDAVGFSIRNLILTSFYERPFQPEIGTGIRALLFELFDPYTQHQIKREIRTVIQNFEPRAVITDLEVTTYFEDNAIEIEIFYYAKGIETQETLKVVLRKVR